MSVFFYTNGLEYSACSLTVQHLRETSDVFHLLHRHAHFFDGREGAPCGDDFVAESIQAL